jgi:fructose-bisphosphate aldolase/6-deoxy-5-ketofructose 1-phosphate synthase
LIVLWFILNLRIKIVCFITAGKVMKKKDVDTANVSVPLTVARSMRGVYVKNYRKATLNSGRLLLFAGDQKIEHLNDDFYGEGIDPAAADPRHLFEIASKGRIGVFATHFGLIARYGEQYKDINYVVKLNAKTNLASLEADPLSLSLATVDDVVALERASKLNIVGVGYTVYLGSRYESQMLVQAAQVVQQAHAQGKLAILWMYPRGKAVVHERTANVIAGAAGVAPCLGADFVKVNPPEAEQGCTSAQLLRQATAAAGNTKVICSGGSQKDPGALLEEIYQQIHTGGAAGAAVGRNIHQRSLMQACALTRALSAIIIDGDDVATAKKLLTV